jgi:phage shock protein A
VSALDRARAALAGTLAEIRDARRAATEELVAFRAGEKVMAARARELAEEASDWQRRAELAVQAGDDALAREALRRRSWVIAELGQLQDDREAQGRIAADLLRGRRELDAALQRIELRQGTVAAGLAAARTGASPLTPEGETWDRFAEAERRIEEDAIVAELAETEIDPADLASQKVGQLEAELRAGQALEALKARMKDQG